MIGEHTDYNDGLVLPMILDRATYVAARTAPGQHHRIRAHDLDDELTLATSEVGHLPQGHWGAYVTGMLEEFNQQNPLEILVTSTLPREAGLSSSAALTTAVGLAIGAATGQSVEPFELAAAGQRVEHRRAGVQCGIMDQMASSMGRSGHGFLLDCQSMHWQHIPVRSQACRFIVVNSKVRRSLATSEYNRRRTECMQALQSMGRNSMRDISISDLRKCTDRVLRRRAQHVVEENMRVRQAAAALRTGDDGRLGALMTASHRSLRDLYEVSCTELDFLVKTTLELPGVKGSRMMGGGFGGCTITLVERDGVAGVVNRLRQAYLDEFGLRADAWVAGPGVEAGVLE